TAGLGLALSLVACSGAAPLPASPEAAATARLAASATGTRYAGDDCTRRHPGTGPARTSLERRGSAVVLARRGHRTLAYVADEDTRALHLVDVEGGGELGTTRLPGAPAQALVVADGRVAVTLRDRSTVLVLEPADDPSTPLATLCEVGVPSEAYGLAASRDDT